MRYAPDHKDETRTKILRAAAASMRARGPDGVAVAGLMRSVGLTHGGFYAHFGSKDELIAAAVGQMFADTHRTFQRITQDVPRAAALGAYIDRYVSAAHRDDAARGCPLTSVAMDLSRQHGAARAAFDAGVAGILERLAGWLPPGPVPAAERAAALLAEMAGAVALARAVSDPALSDSILQSCRESVRRGAGLPARGDGDPA